MNDVETAAAALVLEHAEALSEGLVNKSQLARMLQQKFPGKWPDLKGPRSAINRACGTAGQYKSKLGLRIETGIDTGLRALKSHAKQLERVELSCGKWLVLSDIHLPYHDPVALDAAVEHGIENGCDHVLLNGDIMDCHYLSRYDKTPGSPDMSVEVDYARRFLAAVSGLFPGDIVWKFGNHEDRFDRYVISKATELFGLPGMNLEALVAPQDYGCNLVVGAYSPMHIGSLCIIHGHEFGGGVTNPVNPARGLFLRAKSSTLAGHNHQSSEHHESSIKGDAMACWSTGCLSELSPSYRPFAFTKWNHGFAVVAGAKDGTFTVQNHRIIDGVVH